MTTALITGVFVFTFLATGAARRYAIRADMLDHPNHRSSHSRPTPRGGGISLALGWMGGVVFLFSQVGTGPGLALFGGGAAVALAGWLDDHGRASIRGRLMMQALAAGGLVYAVGAPASLDLGAWQIPFGVMGIPLTILGVMWAVNAWNFMDGIDGLAASQAVIAGLSTAAILDGGPGAGIGLAGMALAVSALGFLIWNWPPARIFMGDVGSGLLGFAVGALALAGSAAGEIPLLLLLLPAGPLFVDATATLLLRAARGEKVALPHRRHLYQRVVQSGWTHRRVTAIYAVSSLILAVLAYWGSRDAARTLPALLGGATILVSVGGLLSLRAVPVADAPGSRPETTP